MREDASAERILEAAIDAHVFPAAVAEVGNRAGALWTGAFGRLSFDDDAEIATSGTVFDLASLAKPIATTTVVMQLVEDRRLGLEERLPDIFEDWRGTDRETVTVTDLLEHASGLPARLVEPPPGTRREFEHEICTIRLEYEPRTRSVYSDLGFILLGFLAETRGAAGLDAQFEAIRDRLGIEASLAFAIRLARGDAAGAAGVAPTAPLPEDRRRRRLAGEVHDEYANALGGVAGHAGLFGTAGAVGDFARCVLRASLGDREVPLPLTPESVARFTRRSAVRGSSRALGWDTMLPTSSCGTRMSAAAFGHVGYTGTSLWIDPRRDRYFVLLTNRACDGGTLEQMRAVRRAFHDAWGDRPT